MECKHETNRMCGGEAGSRTRVPTDAELSVLLPTTMVVGLQVAGQI